MCDMVYTHSTMHTVPSTVSKARLVDSLLTHCLTDTAPEVCRLGRRSPCCLPPCSRVSARFDQC